ncbi:methyl-accepting chemotaxis protein : Putative periplasmic ligand-binding sensor domain protein OS=Herbaspirillum sp. CF444 GN=PMI16_01711 PE=4 SV=1: CHASE3: MCPsignal [Gemmata massiliana]|uniref:Methyl-accepting transducer domain-containing protein n=1 Tax=Gemmata massiliana TaxID=1210884 RepID=A0A6P2CZC2_9BACT|nr:CHASE3 domain-containing protein [Gemmata massiliana]VTR92560.1 methyl-accepting chemotaxis protein : Putative periplasmic ligand-binding sensor domain protein OS=Herbaspirillum sp. CF444 GN=PMI16_01711 PE=4 SV=1: CHASE3: MCPsignal [Gemmata massiliana]
MTGQWTFGTRLGVGFGFAGLVLLIIGTAGYYSTHRLIENDKRVNHSHQVRRELADLQSELKDAETGQRGFVITGKESYLAPYQSALEQIKITFDRVRSLTTDNVDQQRRLDKLLPLMESKLAELKRTIDQRRKDGFEPTAKVIAEDQGKELMDSIRRVVAEMDRQEQDLLDARSAEAEATASATKAVILWGSLVGVALVALFGWYMVASLRRQIGSAVQHIQSSSNELQAAATQQTTVSREQAASMSEIATTIKELVATARQIAESAQRVAGIAEDTARGARTGDQTLKGAQDAVANIRGQVDLIVSHMLDLGRKSQQIGGILEVINELAEQTNILAINASIEAAGAGDAGRRFGVVADEIRKLADRVGGSTKDIKSLIEEIRGAVHTTVMATETGSKAVDVGTRQIRDVSAGFQQIVRLVETTTEAAREIELSTKQQTTAVEQVNEAIANIAQASRESEVSSTQTLQTVTELTGLSRNLARLVQPQARA